jgi:gliding motility-associated-like protein
LCNGNTTGSIDLTVAGGSAPYTYSWSTTPVQTSEDLSNLGSGSYTVTVTDDNGCTTSSQVQIVEPAALSATLDGQTNVTCFGGSNGSVSVTPLGGVGPYSISPSQINLSAGTYIFTVTDDNGCQFPVNAQITEPQADLSVSISSQTNVSCNGLNDGSVALSINGGTSPYTTSPSITNLSHGPYTFTVTDNNGCTAQTSITISQPSQITASSSIVDVLCNNGFGSIDLTANGGVGPYDVLWNNTINSEDLTNITAGTYSAAVTDQNNCQETFTYLVANSFAPTPILTNNTGTTILTCSLTSIVYSVTNTNSIIWDGGSNPTSSTNTFSSPGPYTLNVTDANSCPKQFVVNITQDINPPSSSIANLTNTSTLTCTNPLINIQAAGGVSYQWSNGLGSNANQSLTQVGTYTVTVTGSNGCSSTESITITSNQTLPTAVITNNTGSTTLHCNQTQINVTASGGVTYQWSNGLGTNPTVNLTSAGTYTVTATAANGCTDTESITINQVANPTVTVSSITICSGSTGTLTAVPSTPGGSYVWTQLPSNNVLPGTSASVSVNPTSNAVYNVQYFDVNNCPSNTAMANVVVTPTPVVNVSGTTTICSGNNVVITANSSLTGAGGYYTWSPNASSSSSVTVSPAISTAYSVFYTLNGCPSNTANHLVTVYQTPTVSVNNLGICTGSQGTLTATPSVLGGTYSWNTTPNISTTQSITLQPLNTVSYTVVYTSPDNCPSQPATGTITVTDIPSVQVDDISVCEGQSGTLTAVPSVPGGVFIWTPSNGSSGSSYTFSPTSSTSVSVIYSLNDCPSPSTTAQVTLVNTPSVTVNNIGICQNQFGTLTANPSTPGGTFLWSTNETSQSISVNPQSDSTYSVIYFIAGCPSPQASATVTVDPIPVVTFDVDYTEGCLPLTVNLTNTTPNTQNCTWNLGNGATLNECDNLSYTFQNPGCFDISLTTDSPNGCSNTLTLNDLICAYPTPVADFNLSTTEIVEGDNTIFIQNTSSGGIEYIWNYGDDTGDTLYGPESHTYAGTLQESYLISLIAVSDQGCKDSTSQLIRVSDDLVFFAPNTFIPNEDGLNDIWIPVFSSGFNIENYELNIYNRWGQVVFKTEDYLQGWDGKFTDEKVQDGVYTFKITFRNAKDKINQVHVGHINLVR